MQHSGRVTEVLFASSDHVDHARQEPSRYWDAVVTVWHQSQQKKKKEETDEKSARSTPTLRASQLPEFFFEDGVTDADVRMPSKAYIKTSRWSDADSQITLLPSLPCTPCSDKLAAVEERLLRDGFI